jgi:hypothetical protein
MPPMAPFNSESKLHRRLGTVAPGHPGWGTDPGPGILLAPLRAAPGLLRPQSSSHGPPGLPDDPRFTAAAVVPNLEERDSALLGSAPP